MLRLAINQLRIAFILLILFSLLTGLIYPLMVTGIAQLFFADEANGSFVVLNDKTIGSRLIGQTFTDTKYFWGRPSATTPYSYNGESSSGSNLGPSNPDFLATVKDRIAYLGRYSNNSNQHIPIDLVTASGSGLDPEISPYAAFYQVPRIAKARHMEEKVLQELIERIIEYRTLGILGEPRVNVLHLNIALDLQQSNISRK